MNVYRLYGEVGAPLYVRASSSDRACRFARQMGVGRVTSWQVASYLPDAFIFDAENQMVQALEETTDQLRLYAQPDDSATQAIIQRNFSLLET